jgi:L-fucose isomerase-like protein
MDTRRALHLITVMRRMRETKILDYMDAVSEWGMRPGEDEIIREIFGTEIIQKPGQELLKYIDDVDDKEAREWVRKWKDEAEKVVEPDDATLMQSARMYLGLKHAMDDAGATCVSTDCLNYVYRDKFPGYPCLAFFQLMNEGLMGVCEADIHSSLTNLIGLYLTGSPGFVSDPVIDTASNQIIYAHCVCSTMMFPDKPPMPYIIRSHAECNKGASVQVIAKTGQPMTTAKLHPVDRKLALHKGVVVGNVDVDWACRTKIAVEVPDAKALLNGWNVICNFGWHRVSFYGDLEEDFRDLATLYGFTIVENS